uniref:Leucine-rich repeat-containing N-terminal plant-type domain-containing protein n=1 Tax=Glycine max TaxID=3847 RepID=A0A0R0E335_SOYBN
MNGVVHMSMHDLQELSMLRCNLSGPLDPSLARLENLSVIVLDNNNLSSPVAETFSHFKNLKILRLYECELTGTFPQKIFNIRTLSYLDISWNNNLHGFLPEFPSSGSLYSLSVSHTNFSGPIPFSIGNMRNLSELDLSICGFNGIIPNSLSNLTKLSYLDLSLNSFTGPMTLFSVPKKLSHLGLSNNDLSGLIPSSHFEGMHNLFEIDLSYNSFTGSIPSSLFALPSLHQIKLSHKFSELDGFINVTSSTLEILDIMLPKIHSVSVTNADMFSFPYMEVLEMASCNLKTIPGFLKNCSSLVLLDLSDNQIQGIVPNWIWKLDNLVELNISHNFLTVLDLSINSISGTIPSCLMMMMNGTLEALNLKNNNLSGPIPNTVPVSCDGPIPKSLAYCSKLEVLDLGSNQITGGFPCFLKEISTLRVLILRNNKFQGSLKCLKANKTWEMLQIVDIAFNNFSGKLPRKYFTTWKRNITGNKEEAGSKFIEKQISSGNGLYYRDSITVSNKCQQMELVKILTIFTSIDFSSNHFDGPIPQDLMDWKELYVLNLSNNAFSGKIPPSIGNMRKLESLDLSQNSLSGEIPAQLASLSFLSYLNLSFNHLVGKIPTNNDGLYGPPLTKNPDHKEQELRIGRNEMLSYAVPLVFGTLLDRLQRIAQSAPTSF